PSRPEPAPPAPAPAPQRNEGRATFAPATTPESDPASHNDLAAAVAETERNAIMQALEATRWNRTAAAKKLGLTLRQLRYRLERLGIE
ncbi:MAG: helix-turn-helix domain-containing protein, partial [Rhodanobacteraceae bacterium]